MNLSLHDSLEGLVMSLDKDEIKEKVSAVKRKYPDCDREALAKKLSKKAARKCAVLGGIWGTLSGPISLLGVNPDFKLLIARQAGLVLSISHLFGRDLDSPERIYEIYLCLVGDDGEKPAVADSGWMLENIILNNTIGFLKAGKLSIVAARFVPFFGTAYYSAANYNSTKMIGMKTIALYSEKKDDEATSSSSDSNKKGG